MFAPLPLPHDRRRWRHALPLAGLLLGALLATPQTPAQTQPNSNLPQNQHPATTPARPGTVPPVRPGTIPAQPAPRWHLPFFGAKQNAPGTTNSNLPGARPNVPGATSNNLPGARQNAAGAVNNNGVRQNAPGATNNNLQAQHRFWNNLFHRNTGAQPAQQQDAHLAGGAQRPAAAAANHSAAAAAPRSASHPPMRLASLDSGAAAKGGVQSRALLAPAGLPGTRIAQSPSGALVRTAADGSIIDTRNPKNGMVIQHGLDGSRRVTVEQPDGSRVFAASRGAGYVQHPFLFHAQPFDHRTSYLQGHVSHTFYRPYQYAGTTLDVYAPQRFYSADFYRSVSTPYSTPLVPQWNYVATPTPWYGYYKSYFTPETSYSSPALWLTDFVLATSLIEAYQTHPKAAAAPPPADSPALTPEVKEKVAEEVNRQVKEESIEARENAQERDLQPGTGGVVKELEEKEPHVFVAVADLDLVDPSGRRCMLTGGDVIQVISAARPKSGTAEAVVLSSKGAGACQPSTQVDIAVSDLQEMQNHMREIVDQGLASSKAGGQAQTVTPAFAAAAPPPDQNAAQEIQRQQEIAAAADG